MTRAMEFNQVCVETARKTKAAEAEANAFIKLVYDFVAVDNPSKALDALTRLSRSMIVNAGTNGAFSECGTMLRGPHPRAHPLLPVRQ